MKDNRPPHQYSAHESAIIESKVIIGQGTKVSILQTHGSEHHRRDCVLGQNVVIERNVTIGDRVKIQNNVSVYRGVTLEDDVFVDHLWCLLTFLPKSLSTTREI